MASYFQGCPLSSRGNINHIDDSPWFVTTISSFSTAEPGSSTYTVTSSDCSRIPNLPTLPMHTFPSRQPRADAASAPNTASKKGNPQTPGDASKTPQETLNEFWDKLITKQPSKVTNIFPPSLYTNLLPPRQNRGTIKGKNAFESYQAAVNECRARVNRIVRECHRANEKVHARIWSGVQNH